MFLRYFILSVQLPKLYNVVHRLELIKFDFCPVFLGGLPFFKMCPFQSRILVIRNSTFSRSVKRDSVHQNKLVNIYFFQIYSDIPVKDTTTSPGQKKIHIFNEGAFSAAIAGMIPVTRCPQPDFLTASPLTNSHFIMAKNFGLLQINSSLHFKRERKKEKPRRKKSETKDYGSYERVLYCFIKGNGNSF